MAEKTEHLGNFEEAVLLAVQRLGQEAYGVKIFEWLAEADRHVSIGSLYVTLARLEEKGLVKAEYGEVTPERGGRAKKFISLTGAGSLALSEAERIRWQLRHGGLAEGGLA